MAEDVTLRLGIDTSKLLRDLDTVVAAAKRAESALSSGASGGSTAIRGRSEEASLARSFRDSPQALIAEIGRITSALGQLRQRINEAGAQGHDVSGLVGALGGQRTAGIREVAQLPGLLSAAGGNSLRSAINSIVTAFQGAANEARQQVAGQRTAAREADAAQKEASREQKRAADASRREAEAAAKASKQAEEDQAKAAGFRKTVGAAVAQGLTGQPIDPELLRAIYTKGLNNQGFRSFLGTDEATLLAGRGGLPPRGPTGPRPGGAGDDEFDPAEQARRRLEGLQRALQVEEQIGLLDQERLAANQKTSTAVEGQARAFKEVRDATASLIRQEALNRAGFGELSGQLRFSQEQGRVSEQSAFRKEFVGADGQLTKTAQEMVRVRAETKVIEEQIAREEQQQLLALRAGDLQGIAQVRARSKAQAEEVAALEQEALVGTKGYVESIVSRRLAAEQIDLAVRQQLTEARQVAAFSESETVQQARIRVSLAEKEADLRRQVQSLQEQVAAEEQAGNASTAIAHLTGERLILERRLSSAAAQAAKEQYRQLQSANPQEFPRGSIFQQLYARAYNRGGRFIPETDAPTLGQSLGQGALNSARYAIAGGGLYALQAGLRTIVDETEELDRVLPQVKAQFESLGQGSQFEGFRQGILAVSRDVGVSADQVALFGSRLKGAFGDSAAAIGNVDTAAKFARLTAGDLAGQVDDLLATTRNFGLTGSKAFEQVTDEALSLQEKFGVPAAEIVSFLGDIAPVAKEAGFSLHEIGAVAAIAARDSGRSISSISEALGRVIPQIQSSAGQLVELFRQTGNTDISKKLQDSLNAGNTKEAFKAILQGFDQLAPAQQNYLLTTLGGRRETQALVAILRNSKTVLAEWNSAVTGQGKTEKYFNEVRKSFGFQLNRLAETAKQLGVALFQSGFKDLFTDAIKLAQTLAQLLVPLFQLIHNISEAFGGWPLRLGEAVAAAALLNKTIATLKGLELLGIGEALSGGLGGFAAGRKAAYGAGALTVGNAVTPFGIGAQRVGSGALGALGLTPASIGLIGAAAVAVAYQNQRGQVEATRRQTESQYSGASTAGLLRGLSVAEQGQNRSLFGPVQRRLFGDPVPGLRTALSDPDRVRIQSQLLRNYLTNDPSSLAAAFNAQRGKPGSLDSTLDEKKLSAPQVTAKVNALVAKAAQGDKKAIKQIADINAALSDVTKGHSDAVLKEIEDVDPKLQAQKAFSPQVIKSLEELKNDLEQGHLGALGPLRAILTTQAQLTIDPNVFGGLDPELQQKILQARKDLVTLEQNAIDAVGKAQDTLLDLFAGDDEAGLKARLTILSSRMQIAASRNDINRTADAAQALIKAQDALTAYQVQHAKSLEEAQRIAGQASTDNRTRAAAIVLQGLNNDLSVAKLQELGLVNASDLPGIAVAVAKGETTVADALGKRVDAEIASLHDLLDNAGNVARAGLVVDTKAATDKLALLEQLRKQLPNLSPGDQAALNLANLTANIQFRYSQQSTRLDIAGIRGQDPQQILAGRREAAASRLADLRKIKAKDEDILAAEKDYAQSVKDEQDGFSDILSARSELRQVLLETNPVASALEALAEARRQEGLAHGEAAKARALANRIKAEDTVRNAQQALFQAQQELLQAQFEALGDQTSAANVGIQTLQKLLADRINLNIQRGTDPNQDPEVINLKTQLVNMTASAEQTRISEEREAIDFDLEFKRITVSQAIARLRLLEGTTKNQDLIRDIEREIARLSQQAGENLQFNLPADLRLPTVYEARRLVQANQGFGAPGIAPSGPTNIVTLNIYNAQDLQAGVNELGRILTGAPILTSTPRTFNV